MVKLRSWRRRRSTEPKGGSGLKRAMRDAKGLACPGPPTIRVETRRKDARDPAERHGFARAASGDAVGPLRRVRSDRLLHHQTRPPRVGGGTRQVIAPDDRLELFDGFPREELLAGLGIDSGRYVLDDHNPSFVLHGIRDSAHRHPLLIPHLRHAPLTPPAWSCGGGSRA